MINQKYKDRLSNKSVIRELAGYARKRGKDIGYENVFDYSLGNPSVDTPTDYNSAVIDMYKTMDSMSLHGYSPSLGNTHAREVIAASLKKRFGIDYETKHIFPTTGAAGAIAHAVRAVTKPGDTVLGFAPFFPEYRPYINDSGAKLEVVPPDLPDFQINFKELEKMMNGNVTAVLINSPNNPSGAVYSQATLERLAAFLNTCQKKYGHDIFIISDEPYREIVFDGKKCPYPSHYYDNTLSCYSFSKSLSLPGERIGYIAVNPRATDADILVDIFAQISRGIGHNCPSSTAQLGVTAVIDETSDLSVYETNMNLLYDALTEIGFEVKRPQGTFYIFPKALEDDAVAFCKKALKYDLIMVPADSFGAPGYVRLAYCIDTEKVRRSIPALKKFAHEVYGK
ncbi:MAG: pyridoxal phosphate-dependent aminotransferase [bacterium LCO1.1]|uniref:Aminotransferase n=1 Tax=Candidatus Weimeria bifida TaxID=2599074 RepID=A0A6N7J0Q1_9FIRM|nr:pyridoxal phosphate-dependent aminotransferase [Candidatus Weimeria bifida]